MRRRSRGPIAALCILVVLTAGLVLSALFFSGAFLPGWAEWMERSDALDGEGAGVVSSLVLKDRRFSLYSNGEEVYRSPSKWKVQDVIWQDLDGNGAREVIALYWASDRSGEQSEPLTGKGRFGPDQHLAVLEAGEGTLHERWVSAPLAIDARSIRRDGDGYLLISESVGKQTAWVWTGEKVVPSSAASPADLVAAVQEAEPAVTETPDTGSSVPAETPPENAQTTAASGETSVSFLAVGDDLVHENVWRTGVGNGGDYSYLFENIIYMINSVDYACFNQETMFVEESVGYTGYPMFGSPLGIGEAAIRAGFNIVTCSTNHSMDKSLYGIETTADFFESHKAEITYLGIYTRDKWEEPVHEIKTVTKNGITFALLNFTYGLNGIPIPAEGPYSIDTYRHDADWYGEATVQDDETRMRDAIRRAKEISDVVIFFPHWGQEYVYEPVHNPHLAYDQVYWTNLMLEEGVDIVVGTHPHVVEPVEMLVREDGHEMLVYYSLGNYVSGQNEMPRVLGGMATFTVTKKGDRCYVSAYDLLPMVTHQERGGITTTYMLDDYTEELAARHVLGVNLASMRNLFRNIIDWNT